MLRQRDEQRCESLRGELAAKVEQCHELSTQLAAIQSQSVDAASSLEVATARLTASDERLRTLERTNAELSAENIELRRQVDRQNLSLAEYERALEEMGGQLSECVYLLLFFFLVCYENVAEAN